MISKNRKCGDATSKAIWYCLKTAVGAGSSDGAQKINKKKEVEK